MSRTEQDVLILLAIILLAVAFHIHVVPRLWPPAAAEQRADSHPHDHGDAECERWERLCLEEGLQCTVRRSRSERGNSGVGRTYASQSPGPTPTERPSSQAIWSA